jgi:hypothetical protein
MERGVTTPRTDVRPRDGSFSMTSSSGRLAMKSMGVTGETVGERDGDPEPALCARRPRDGVGEVKSAESLWRSKGTEELDVDLMTESGSVECNGGEWLEDDLFGLLLPVDLDLELDLPNTGARDKDRLVREFDRLRAASDEDLNSEEGPPELVELECYLGGSAERNFD